MQLSRKKLFFIDDKCSDTTFQYKYMKEIKKEIMFKHKDIKTNLYKKCEFYILPNFDCLH